jgi:hypothetical protein
MLKGSLPGWLSKTQHPTQFGKTALVTGPQGWSWLPDGLSGLAASGAEVILTERDDGKADVALSKSEPIGVTRINSLPDHLAAGGTLGRVTRRRNTQEVSG